MSGDQERTQPATPKRLERARQEGDVAKSATAASALAIASVIVPCIASGAFVRWWVRAFGAAVSLAAFAGATHGASAGAGLAASRRILFESTPWEFVFAAWAAACAGSFAAAAATGALGASWGALRPKPGRLSWAAGTKALFGTGAIAHAVVAVASAAALIACAVPPLRAVMAGAASPLPLSGQPAFAQAVVTGYWRNAVIAMLVVAAADVAFARRRHAAKLRMTQKEARDERADQEGRPEIKARRRAIGARRARRLRVSSIKHATAVVTNPTRIAVALRYAPPGIDVPTVVSSGAGAGAAVVRAVASFHDIPIVEAPELARALYANVDLDETIPEELYHAVAAIFAWILRTRGKLGGSQ
jgi:flagellar biosynthetic protein FlhB